MDRAELTLARDIGAFAGVAVPSLLALLDSSELRLRRFAAHALSTIDGLTDEHLDALIAARGRGNEEISLVIAHVGSTRAIQVLVDDLRQQPRAMSTQTAALIRVAPRAAAPLARIFDAPSPVSEELTEAVCHIFDFVRDDAEPAVDVLVARASRAEAPTVNRLLAVRALGCMGPTARRAAPTLMAIAATAPDDFRAAANAAVISIRSPEAVPLHLATLRKQPSVIVLRDIAEMREDGRAAGPAVAAFVASSHRELRVAAARTLGYIDYRGRTEALVTLLFDKDDWHAAYVAAEALGRLRVSAALTALDQIAKSHWFPPVRESARRAASVIRKADVFDEYPDTRSLANFPFEYFAYRDARVYSPDRTTPALVPGPNELSPAELSSLSYDALGESYGEDGRTVPTVYRQTPEVGLRTGDGALVGAALEGTGGELMHLGGKSGPSRLLGASVRGIHRLGSATVVVTGSRGMFLDAGALYLVKPVGPGTYRASFWKRLPGAAQRSGLMADGGLFISCTGADIIVKPGGRMQMADAKP